MAWDTWIRDGVEVLPSLYAADFLCLGAQIEALLAAGTRVFHFDVGDGHFVPPVTIGPVVLRAIAPPIRAAGGVIDCHLMVDNPAHHFEEIAASGGQTVTFHYEVATDCAAVAAAAHAHGLVAGLAFNPGTSVAAAAEAALAAGVDHVLCMSINPGYSGQPFMAEALDRVAELRGLLPAHVPIEVDGGIGRANIAELAARGASLLVAGSSIFGEPDPAAAYAALVAAARDGRG